MRNGERSVEIRRGRFVSVVQSSVVSRLSRPRTQNKRIYGWAGSLNPRSDLGVSLDFNRAGVTVSPLINFVCPLIAVLLYSKCAFSPLACALPLPLTHSLPLSVLPPGRSPIYPTLSSPLCPLRVLSALAHQQLGSLSCVRTCVVISVGRCEGGVVFCCVEVLWT